MNEGRLSGCSNHKLGLDLVMLNVELGGSVPPVTYFCHQNVSLDQRQDHDLIEKRISLWFLFSMLGSHIASYVHTLNQCFTGSFERSIVSVH